MKAHDKQIEHLTHLCANSTICVSATRYQLIYWYAQFFYLFFTWNWNEEKNKTWSDEMNRELIGLILRIVSNNEQKNSDYKCVTFVHWFDSGRM